MTKMVVIIEFNLIILVIGKLGFKVCFGFRVSDFEFPLRAE